MNIRLLRRRRFLTYLSLGALGIGSAACAAKVGSTSPASKTSV